MSLKQLWRVFCAVLLAMPSISLLFASPVPETPLSVRRIRAMPRSAWIGLPLAALRRLEAREDQRHRLPNGNRALLNELRVFFHSRNRSLKMAALPKAGTLQGVFPDIRKARCAASTIILNLRKFSESVQSLVPGSLERDWIRQLKVVNRIGMFDA